MGRPDVMSNVVPVGVGKQLNISQKRVEELFGTPISAESRRKRAKQRNRIDGIRKAERASRKVEERQVGTYEMLLGIRTINKDTKPSILSEEQKQVIKTAIMEESPDPEEQHVLRESIIGSTKVQEDFVALYTKWNSDWQADNNPDKPDFKEYVRLKGREFIKESAKEFRMGRADKFFDENRDAVNLTDEEKEAEREKFRKALDMYFQANGVALAELNSLDDKEKTVRRQELMNGFMKIMAENGFEKTEKGRIETIFDLFVGDFEYEYAVAYEEWEYTYEELMEMVLLGLTPEEWEKRRQAALKKNAKGELQEYLQQQTAAPVYTGAYESAPSSYGSVREVANACGVNFVSAGAPDTYRIKAPSVADSSFSPLMVVVYDPPDQRDMEHASFLIQQRWQDEDAKDKGETVNGVMTVSYTPKEAIRGVNTAILDHVINQKINIVLPENAKQGTNRLIREKLMVDIAERLLAFKMKDRPIREDEVRIFQRFMEVVLREDEDERFNAPQKRVKDEDERFNALQKRAKVVETLINNDYAIQLIQSIFDKDGGKVRTLRSLVEELSQKGISV